MVDVLMLLIAHNIRKNHFAVHFKPHSQKEHSMSFSKISLLQSLALFFVITSSSLSVSAQQTDPMSPMNQQLAKFGGTMHAIAEVCGDYSADQLAESKKQQKAQLTQSGMSATSFDEAFATGLNETRAKWDTISEKERKEVCEKM